MAGTEHLREILAGAADNLRVAQLDGQNHAREERLQRAAGYARGVLDALAAVMADEDADERVDARTLSTERRRGPDGRFEPSEHTQALRDGTAVPS